MENVTIDNIQIDMIEPKGFNIASGWVKISHSIGVKFDIPFYISHALPQLEIMEDYCIVICWELFTDKLQELIETEVMKKYRIMNPCKKRNSSP